MSGPLACRLRFWFEWGVTSCLWAHDEAATAVLGPGPVDLRRLSLSAGAIARAERLCAWYQTALNWDYPPDPGPWRQEECERFNAAALALLEAISTELGGDFEVVNAQDPVSEDPDLDAYLKDPKGFRRR